MTYYDRPSLNVHLIDKDKATALIRSKCPNPELSEVVVEPMVVVLGKKGYATVCTEGVGWWKDDNDKYCLLWYLSHPYYNHGYVDVTEDELLPLISDEVVDLAKFIRQFGDRLENNFYIWYSYGLGFNQTTPAKVGA